MRSVAVLQRKVRPTTPLLEDNTVGAPTSAERPFVKAPTESALDGPQDNLRVPKPNLVAPAGYRMGLSRGIPTISVHRVRDPHFLFNVDGEELQRSFLDMDAAPGIPAWFYHYNHRPSPIPSATVFRLRGVLRMRGTWKQQQAAGEFSSGPSCKLPLQARGQPSPTQSRRMHWRVAPTTHAHGR